MKSQVIVWSWREQPPITKIFRAAKRIKSAKLWRVDWGGDADVLVIAKDKATAWKAYNKSIQNKNPDWNPEIIPWVDQG